MRRIKYCLNGKLAEIYQSATQLDKLNSTLALYLPKALQPHCQVGSFYKGCLTLVTTDSVWASQLRYHVPELRDALRQKANLYQLISIRIHIATEKPNHTSKKKLTLTHQAREHILASSDQCTYQPLKQALLRLAGENNRENS